MERRYTKGPWEVTKYWDLKWGVCTVEGKHPICVMNMHKEPSYSEGTPESNARLISLAPEMLEELQVLVKSNFGQPSGVTVPALDRARELIVKATGGVKENVC